MAESKEKKLEIHLFYSLKGGSGKTTNATFRVFKTIFKKPPNEKGVGTDINAPGICFIDADFRGTMLEACYANHLEGRGSPCFAEGFDSVPRGSQRANRKNKDHIYYSKDIIDMTTMTAVNRLDRVVYKNDNRHDTGTGGTIAGVTEKHFTHSWAYDIAFCNPDSVTKNAFVTNTTSFDGGYVKIDYFRAQFRDFILCLAETHDIIVIDMAPGKDEYAKAIFEICFNMNLSGGFKDHYSTHTGIQKDDAKVNVDVTLHLVTTPDQSHIAATGETLVEFITSLSMLEKGPDAIEVIISESGYFEYNDSEGNIKYSGDREAEYVRDKITKVHDIETRIENYLSQNITQRGREALSKKIKYSYQKYVEPYNFKDWGEVNGKELLEPAVLGIISVSEKWNVTTTNQFLDAAKVFAAEAKIETLKEDPTSLSWV